MGKTFGKLPSGERLQRIQQSPNYKDGAFQNLSHTAVMREDASFWKVLKDFTQKPPTVKPVLPLQVQHFDPAAMTDPSIVWFGHSSYLLKIAGFTLLVDPVFSNNASPVSLFAKAFAGTNVFKVADFGTIDYVLITHDHYDHLDYETMLLLRDKVKHFYMSLGVGTHLEYWGIPKEKITELDWWESAQINATTSLTATPARHFSGRGIKRAQTLWSSFVLKTDHGHYFLGGDSGYDTHFKTIGEKYGPFELAILECGQYGADWPNIHTTPEETLQAALDLGAKTLLPVHWSKFVLAAHPWREPVERLIAAAQGQPIQLITPSIGEVVALNELPPQNAWWEQLK